MIPDPYTKNILSLESITKYFESNPNVLEKYLKRNFYDSDLKVAIVSHPENEIVFKCDSFVLLPVRYEMIIEEYLNEVL